MEKKDIIIFVVALSIALGFRLYKNYKKKKGAELRVDDSKTSADQMDDYEPYSGKN